MSVRDSIKTQIIAHLKNAEFPISTPETLLASFPSGADIKCSADDLVVTTGQVGELLSLTHFPFESAEDVGEIIVELVKL